MLLQCATVQQGRVFRVKEVADLLTWLHMRLDGLVSLFQFPCDIDDVKSSVSQRVYPDLFHPGYIVQIKGLPLCRNCLNNLQR